MFGQLDEAHTSFVASLDLGRAVESDATVGIALNNLGGVAFDQADYASAARYYAQAIPVTRQPGRENIHALATANLAIARMLQGDRQVRDLLDESLAIGESMQNLFHLAFTLVILALLANGDGQHARVTRLLGAAERMRDLGGLAIPPPERPYHEKMGADARQALGEATFAACWATGRGWTIAEALAYGRLRAEPAAISEAANATTPPAAPPTLPAPTVTLTRREREVLALLVASRTNREIAATLSISERTVEDYVANITTKLGATNRVQAVTQAFALGLAE